MAAANVRAERSTRDRAIPASIRRRYGYPAPYRGPIEDTAAQVAELAAEVQALRLRVQQLEAERDGAWT